jgi:hypothetical protein
LIVELPKLYFRTMHKRNNYIFWILSAFLIAGLWLFQYKISVNVPWWDDFHGIILPVFHLYSDIPFVEKLKLFFSLNNEHRVVNDRIFLLLIYLISGTFELKTLAILGFINLIGIFILLVKVAKPVVGNSIYLLPLSLLIFQAQYFESLQSLMVPFQNFSVTLYVFLTYYFLIFKKIKSFLPASIFAVLAIFSHGNGILAFLVGIIILFFNKRNREGIIWTILSTAVIVLYFWDYKKPEWSSGVSVSDNPMAALRYVFEFFGAYALNITDASTTAKTIYGKSISESFGLILVIVFFAIFFKKYPIWKQEALLKLRHSKADQFIIAVFGFLFATGLMIGISRTGFSMLSRYTINSAFLVLITYLFTVSNTKYKKTVAITSIIFTSLLLILSYLNNFDLAIFNRKNAVTDGINYQKTGLWSNQYSDSAHVAKLKPLLVEPYKSNKYIFPASILNDYNKLNSADFSNNLNYGINDGVLEISGILNNKLSTSSGENGIYFTLESDSLNFIFPTIHQKNNLLQILTSGRYFSERFRTIYPVKLIPKDNYKIYQIAVQDNEITKLNLNKTLGQDGFIR